MGLDRDGDAVQLGHADLGIGHAVEHKQLVTDLFDRLGNTAFGTIPEISSSVSGASSRLSLRANTVDGSSASRSMAAAV
ncbi:hypothetical protein V3C33_17510 [Micrococcaceae bacterium Sec5.7]